MGVNLYTFLKLALYEGGQLCDSIVLSPRQKVNLSANHFLIISRPISDSWLNRKSLHLILLWWIINFNANMKLDFAVNLVYEYAGYLESPHQTSVTNCALCISRTTDTFRAQGTVHIKL
jgi:hypothetical protein